MISNGAIAGMLLLTLFELALPIVAYIVLRRRAALRIHNVLVGVGVFVVFVFLLQGAVHAVFLRLNVTTAAWLVTHPLPFAIYIALTAALFEETGRFVGNRFLVRRDPGVATPLAYGLGHGGIECILVGAFSTASLLVMGLLVQSGHGEVLKLPPESIEQIKMHLGAANFFNSLVGGPERASGLVFQIALSFLVWRAVTAPRLRLLWWLAAVGAHFAINLPAGLVQAGVLAPSVILLEAGYLAAASLIVTMLVRTRGQLLLAPGRAG